MKMVRRQFLHFAGAATAFFASPYVVRAQAQAPRISAPPTRSAQDRLEEALARIADPNGEGSRACLTVYAQAARAAAEAADARARIGTNLGPLDGAIVTIKDLFDVAGEPTRAGSKVLADAPPATTDAPALRRLRAGGAVIVAKTNMTEFAFSGIGANPHYGTPGNPADRMRVPGGSSSGAAVAVADGMCEIAIGSDTGGSTRVPAALCGVVGYKPTKSRVPTEGAFPLSYTLDLVGPIARSVAACAAADAVMAGHDPWTLEPVPLQGLRLGIPQGLPLRGLDQTVAAQFSDATKELGRTGVRLSDEVLPLLDDMVRVNSKATFAVAEFLVDPSRTARDACSRLRSLRPLPDRSGAHPVRRRLHGHAPRPDGPGARDGCPSLRSRRACVADDADRRSDDRRSLEQRRLHRQECTGPSQSCDRQFLRSLRDFTSAAARGRAAGWTDARCTQWA